MARDDVRAAASTRAAASARARGAARVAALRDAARGASERGECGRRGSWRGGEAGEATPFEGCQELWIVLPQLFAQQLRVALR